MEQVRLFTRPENSSWASDTWVNLAPSASPITTIGKTVAGVPQGWESVSPSIVQQAPATARINPVKRPGQSLGPAGTGEAMSSPGAAPSGSASQATADLGGAVKPTGMLMSSYANTESARTMQAYIQEAVTATPAPGTFDELVSQYKTDPSAFTLSPEEIQDLSKETGSRWNFGTLSAPNALVVHHTAGGGTAEGVIQTFTERNFPAHFVIDREGQITQVLGLDQKGQHTRPAQDDSGISNANSWGVEVIAKDDSDVLPVQAAATVRLSKYLETYGLDPNRVVGHGAINAHKQATEGQSIVTLLRQING